MIRNFHIYEEKKTIGTIFKYLNENLVQGLNIRGNKIHCYKTALVSYRLQICSTGPSQLTFSFHSATDGECNKVLAKAEREI